MKYIDSEKLIAEIENKILDARSHDWHIAENYCEEILYLVHSLQQEQPEQTCKTCGFYENNCPFIRNTFKPYPNRACKDYTYSVMKEQEQPEVDIVPLQEEKMARYINYCLQREDDDCICPNCGKYVTGLRLFPYYYDRENNDVYFASVCPECGKIIISKE